MALNLEANMEQTNIDEILNKTTRAGKSTKIKRPIVVQHNSLIEARYKLTALEQKFMLFACSKVDRTKSAFFKIQIKYSDIFELLDLKNTKAKYKRLGEIISGLSTKELFIYNKDDETLLQTTWMAGALHTLEGYVEVAFHYKLEPLLLQLKKNFTKAYLTDIIRFKGSHTIRLFLIFSSYQNMRKDTLLYFDLAKMKRSLFIENKYKDFKNFKVRVLLPAQREFKKNTTQNNFLFKVRRGRNKVVLGIFIYLYNQKTDKHPTMPKPSFDNVCEIRDIDKIFAEYRKNIRQRKNATS